MRESIAAFTRGHPNASRDELVGFALELTADRLSFVFDKAQRDPNRLAASGRANCVGYAAFFNSVFNHAARRTGSAQRLRSDHVVGKLTLYGKDAHAVFDSPFFRDHDFNRVTDRATREVVYVDPSLYDYAGMRYVNGPER